jgi:hypothetical protein
VKRDDWVFTGHGQSIGKNGRVLEMIETKIFERLASLETKADYTNKQLDELKTMLSEHQSRHFQISLLGWGAVITSVGAVVTAIMV